MRRIVVIALGLIVLLAAAWSGFWFHTAHGIPARVAAWADAQRAHGLVADYAGISVHGFPLSWKVTIARPKMAGAGPTNWQWDGDSAIARLRPWAMHDIPMRFPGVHHVAGGAGGVAETLVLKAARPDGRLRLGVDGKLERLTLDLGDLELQRLPGSAITTARHVVFELAPHRVPQPTYRTDVLDIRLDAEDATLPAAPANGLGDIIAQARFETSIKGSLPPGRLADAIAAWRDGGGVIEVHRIALRWGPLDANADGTLTLDDTNRPLAAFTAHVRGYGETVDALAATGAVRPRDAAAVKIALNLLARETGPGGTRELNVPITVQDGRLTVAGFPLARIPPLHFE